MGILNSIKRKLLLRTRYHRLVSMSRHLGFGNYFLNRLRLGFSRITRSDSLVELRAKRSRYPLYARPCSSDSQVFEQIFVELEFQGLDKANLKTVRTIIDCGANVGYASAYLLSRYQDARVVAVEPDADNFALLTKNLMPYADRVRLIRGGVWSHSCELVISEQPYRDAKEWSVQVREKRPGESNGFPAYSISELIEQAGVERVSILKIDVEGAEVKLLAGPIDWLSKVDCLTIELHDDSIFGSGSAAFKAAVTPDRFSITRSGELTIAVPRPDYDEMK